MELPPNYNYSKKAKTIVVIFALLVVVLHFIIGPHYQGPYRTFISGYLINLILPASAFLLAHTALQQKLPFKVSRFASVILVLCIGFLIEILQYFGIHIFGNTYDPLDFLMYILGVIIGLLIDWGILKL